MGLKMLTFITHAHTRARTHDVPSSLSPTLRSETDLISVMSPLKSER